MAAEKVTTIAAVYDEIAEFFTSSPTLQQITEFHPSEDVQERIRYLLYVNREGTLTTEERDELDKMEIIDHLISMVKIRALEKLTHK